SVTSGTELNVEDFVTDIEIDLTGNLDAVRGLINPFKGHVNHFNLEVNNDTQNMVGENGVPIPETPHEADDAFVPFTVSGNGATFAVGDEDVEIVAGEIEAVIESKLAPLVAVCTPPEDNVITTVTVEEEQEPEDTTAPVITLNGENPMELEVGDTYEEPGASAVDDVDGDVSENIEMSGDVDTSVVEVGRATYSDSDAAGDEAIETRIVNVVEAEEEQEPEDTTAPVITLNGENPMELEVGATYEEPGASAVDDVDGDVSENIEMSGDVDTSVVGEYTITYTVSDAAGNEATETRIVNIVKVEEEPGEPGQDGEDGEDGQEGQDGQDGEDGEDGEPGPAGPKGEPGNDGSTVEDDNDQTVIPSNVSNNNGPGTSYGSGTTTPTSTSGTLPNTATNTPLLMAIGAGLLLVGLVVMAIRRKTLVK